MATVLLISGSPSATSRSAAVLEYSRRRLAEGNVEARTVSVRDFPPQDLLFGKYDSPAFIEVKKMIADADALVIGTPVYKAAYSGALKTLLDVLPQSAFQGKTVLPIATGGSPSHLLAIDYALKPVLSAMGATDLLQGVYVVDTEATIGADGVAVLAEPVATRLNDQIDQLADGIRRRFTKVA
jgi:FMN reductase